MMPATQQIHRKEPRKMITSMSLNDDSEQARTQELFKRMSSILDRLRPHTFQQLMRQVTRLAIDTEERLKGVIDLIYEKAISEPDLSVVYANMSRCLMGLKVQVQDQPGVTLNFRKLLLNRCQVEFEKELEKDDDEIFEKKQKELEGASSEEEMQRLVKELEDAKDKARRRSLGNIKFICELFKLKLLTEAIMHDCIVKLLENHDEESLECLCMLLSTIGKDLDFEKAKPRMDQYFNQMEKIIKEEKTTSRIRVKLQEVLNQRWHWNNAAAAAAAGASCGVMGTYQKQDHRKITKTPLLDFNNQLLAPGGKGNWGSWGKGSSSSTSAKPADSAKREMIGIRLPRPTPTKLVLTEEELDEKSTPIIREHLHINKMKEALNSTQLLFVRNGLKLALECNAIAREHMGVLLHQLLKTGTLSTQQYYKGLQEILEVAEDMSIDVPHMWLYLAELITPMLLEGGIPMGELFREISKPLVPLGKAGVLLVHILTLLCKGMSHKKAGTMWREAGLRWKDFLPEDVDVDKFVTEQKVEFTLGDESEKSKKKELSSAELSKHLDRLIHDKSDNQRIFDWVEANLDEQQTSSATPPPPQTLTKPALTEEELEKKSTAIIEEYLHINDMKEALQCVQEMNSTQLLFVFVRNGLESTLERSTIAREHMGLLLHQLLKTGTLPTQQYYKGFQEILEAAEDMSIDVPNIWLYLAELITPMLLEGGTPMGELFREISKPLVPLGKAGVLLVHILTLLRKRMSHKKAGTMWREAGLRWKDFLPEDVDVDKFVTEQKVEFTLGDESEKSKKKELSSAELSKHLDRLIHDKSDNQRIFDWVEANLDEQQTSSNMFVRALMTSICQSAIICENGYRVDGKQVNQRAMLLQKYLWDEQKELQALYALQALMVQMEQPANLLRMFFDALYDEDVIKEEALFKWESSKDPAEQQGKGVALKSVTAFFSWLREAEEEYD